MQTIRQNLEIEKRFKSAYNVEQRSDLAKFLGVERQAVSNYIKRGFAKDCYKKAEQDTGKTEAWLKYGRFLAINPASTA